MRFNLLSQTRFELSVDRPDGSTFTLDTAATTAPSSTSCVEIGASTTSILVGSATVSFHSAEWVYADIGLMNGASGSAVFDEAGLYPLRVTYFDSASSVAIGGIKLISDANNSAGELVAVSVGP